MATAGVASARGLGALLRSDVKEAYRTRGHRTNNLWLVYSLKADRDCLIASDLELIHWICFLEMERSVETFSLSPDPLLLPDEHAIRSLPYTALATYKDGHRELHEVRQCARLQHDITQLTNIAQASFHSPATQFRVFDEDLLRESAPVAIRWLTALGYAAAIRGGDHHPEMAVLANLIHRTRQGTVKDILDALLNYDSATVLGALVRLAVRGSIFLDLSKRGLGYQTRWGLYDQPQ
jgi:hypothetical protein